MALPFSCRPSAHPETREFPSPCGMREGQGGGDGELRKADFGIWSKSGTYTEFNSSLAEKQAINNEEGGLTNGHPDPVLDHGLDIAGLCEPQRADHVGAGINKISHPGSHD